MKRTVAALSIAAIALSVLVCLPGAASARDKVHRGPFWSWTGPPDWVGAYGKNGITVSSPSGTSVIDLGFSSILCTPAGSVADSTRLFMAGQRNSLRTNGVTFTQVGRIRRVNGLGINYFRQTNEFRARVGGTRIRGVAVFDYQVPDPTYCYQNLRVMHAPANGFRARFRQLNRIYHSFAYFGPGAPIPPRN